MTYKEDSRLRRSTIRQSLGRSCSLTGYQFKRAIKQQCFVTSYFRRIWKWLSWY